jgi:hypothetical protein
MSKLQQKYISTIFFSHLNLHRLENVRVLAQTLVPIFFLLTRDSVAFGDALQLGDRGRARLDLIFQLIDRGQVVVILVVQARLTGGVSLDGHLVFEAYNGRTVQLDHGRRCVPAVAIDRASLVRVAREGPQ